MTKTQQPEVDDLCRIGLRPGRFAAWMRTRSKLLGRFAFPRVERLTPSAFPVGFAPDGLSRVVA